MIIKVKKFQNSGRALLHTCFLIFVSFNATLTPLDGNERNFENIDPFRWPRTQFWEYVVWKSLISSFLFTFFVPHWKIWSSISYCNTVVTKYYCVRWRWNFRGVSTVRSSRDTSRDYPVIHFISTSVQCLTLSIRLPVSSWGIGSWFDVSKDCGSIMGIGLCTITIKVKIKAYLAIRRGQILLLSNWEHWIRNLTKYIFVFRFTNLWVGLPTSLTCLNLIIWQSAEMLLLEKMSRSRFVTLVIDLILIIDSNWINIIIFLILCCCCVSLQLSTL